MAKRILDSFRMNSNTLAWENHRIYEVKTRMMKFRDFSGSVANVVENDEAAGYDRG